MTVSYFTTRHLPGLSYTTPVDAAVDALTTCDFRTKRPQLRRRKPGLHVKGFVRLDEIMSLSAGGQEHGPLGIRASQRDVVRPNLLRIPCPRRRA
jgi:hypothetical protein